MAVEPAFKPKTASDFPLRLASAVVMVGVAAVGEFSGGVVFTGLIALVSALVLYEWSTITGPYALKASPKLAIGFVALTVFMASRDPAASLMAMTAVALGAAMAGIIDPKMRWLSAGLIYATLPGISTVVLRGQAEPGEFSHGFFAIALVLAIVVATDTVAYFSGKAIGGPKLWPAVSPKKTWSGAIGGMIGGIAAGLGVAMIAGLALSLPLVLLCAVLSVSSQIGDLAESAFKRHFGVKDSSHLIPGHGGIMDRVDGHLVALTLAAVIGLVRSDGVDIAKGLLVW